MVSVRGHPKQYSLEKHLRHKKEKKKRQRKQKRKRRSKKKLKKPTTCWWLLSFSKNCLKCKKVCSFQYRLELIYWSKFNEVEVTEGNWWRVTIEREKKKRDNIASYLGVFLAFWTKKIAVRKRSMCSILKMKLDTASLKPRICAICKRDLAETASPNDCEYCVLC